MAARALDKPVTEDVDRDISSALVFEADLVTLRENPAERQGEKDTQRRHTECENFLVVLDELDHRDNTDFSAKAGYLRYTYLNKSKNGMELNRRLIWSSRWRHSASRLS